MALAGFNLVSDFGDAAAEARACRTGCALFDFSFLECVRLEGIGARNVIESFVGRSLSALGEKQIAYALRIGSPERGLVADLTIWRTGQASFEVMSGRREDVLDLLAYDGPRVKVTDLSERRAIFAVQGPRTLEALRTLGGAGSVESLEYFTFCRSRLVEIDCIVGRLGYTGEAGVEIIVDRASAPTLWKALSGHARPAGFAAIDMLRIEAGLVLFTNEFRMPVWPHEVGLQKFCNIERALIPEISLVSFRAEADGLAWPWQPPQHLARPATSGKITVTSACDSVVAGGILGLGYVMAGEVPATIHDSTGTFQNIRLTARPFYDTAKRRPRASWR